MTQQQWIALALAALLAFWMVGAYNRLVALRNVIGDAWAKVDEALRQRAAALDPMLGELRSALEGEHGALQALDAGMAASAAAASTLRTRPVVVAHAAAWVSAEAALAAAASRVFALLDQHAALGAEPAVAAGIAGWRDAQSRLGFARQLFNEAALTYNSAIAHFPTRLLLRLFSFGPAGLL